MVSQVDQVLQRSPPRRAAADTSAILGVRRRTPAHSSSRMRTALAVLLVALSAFLLFWRLDSIPLWRDEATTANWGRLMAESDVWLPRAYDGDQLIVQGEDGHDINSHLLPAMHSWLQFYVAGAGFQLFGVSTWTARLPFALIGAATLFVFYRIGVALFGNSVQALVLRTWGCYRFISWPRRGNAATTSL